MHWQYKYKYRVFVNLQVWDPLFTEDIWAKWVCSKIFRQDASETIWQGLSKCALLVRVLEALNRPWSVFEAPTLVSAVLPPATCLQTVPLRKRPPWTTADLHLDAPIIGFTWPSNSAFLANWRMPGRSSGQRYYGKCATWTGLDPATCVPPHTLTHPLSAHSSAMHPDIQNFPKSLLHLQGQLVAVTLQKSVATGINAQQSSSRLQE